MRAVVLKLLSAATAAVIVLAGGAFAQVSWNLSDGVLTISGTGAMANYDFVRDSLHQPWGNYPNTNSSITSVVITDGVTSIGKGAFSWCTGLTSVTIPNSVTSIGERAFSWCTGLTSVTIGNSVTSIGQNAFSYCSGLTSIVVDNGNTKYSSIDGVLFSKAQDTLVMYPLGKQGAPYIVPDGVTSIGEGAFLSRQNPVSLTIPGSVTSIGDYAFGDDVSPITSITCLATVPPAVGTGVSFYVKSLVLVPEESVSAYRSADEWKDLVIQAIGGQWMEETWDCGETPGMLTATLTDQEGTLIISGTGAMANYDGYPPWSKYPFIGVTIPNGVTSIGEYAFRNCAGLTSVTIPNSVTSIGEGTFMYCTGLTSVTIPNSVTSIKSSAFSGCTGLTSVTIPNSVTEIGGGAFSECYGLTSVTIPNSVTSIGDWAFHRCSGLTSVTIGNSVTSIGGAAFAGCTGLTSVTSLREIPPTASSGYPGSFSGVSLSSVKLYVPAEAIDAYKTANVWKDFQTVEAAVSVLTPTRVVPPSPPKEEAMVIAPVTVLSGEFTAGPNPVGRQSGGIAFFRQGKRVSGTLSVYDASGNVIKKITVKDNALNNQSRRIVGKWDLTDKKGRPVSEGTYLVKGVIKTSDGKSEKVSLILGVR